MSEPDFSRFEYATGRADWTPSNEVGPGWWPLIHQMMANIEHVAGRKWRLDKLREKMGHLDVDITGSGLDMETFVKASKIVDRAEAESEETCEICGAPGFNATWVLRLRCLCPAHAGAVWRWLSEARGSRWQCELVARKFHIVDAYGVRASKLLLDTIAADLYRSMSSEDSVPRRSAGEIGRELDLLIAARWISGQ